MTPGAMTRRVLAMAFDCAGSACSAVVTSAGRVLGRSGRAMTHGQAEVLVPMIRATLAEAGLGFGDLAAIATTLGPGSFTGLRAGLADGARPGAGDGPVLLRVQHARDRGARRVARRTRGAPDRRRHRYAARRFVSADDSMAPASRAARRPWRRFPMPSHCCPTVPSCSTGDATAALHEALRQAGRDATLAAKAGALDVMIVADLAAARLHRARRRRDAAALSPRAGHHAVAGAKAVTTAVEMRRCRLVAAGVAAEIRASGRSRRPGPRSAERAAGTTWRVRIAVAGRRGAPGLHPVPGRCGRGGDPDPCRAARNAPAWAWRALLACGHAERRRPGADAPDAGSLGTERHRRSPSTPAGGIRRSWSAQGLLRRSRRQGRWMPPSWRRSCHRCARPILHQMVEKRPAGIAYK